MSETTDHIATTLDAVEGAAQALGQGGRGVASSVGRLVAAGARTASRLLRSGMSVDEVVERIERIRPARDQQIDAEVDRVIGRMPSGEDVEGS